MTGAPLWPSVVGLGLSLVGLGFSGFAVWRVEVRNQEDRKQQLLDRAEDAYHELWDLLQLATRTPTTLTDKDIFHTSTGGMGARNKVVPELAPWPYRAPLLPEGEIKGLLKVAAGCVFAAYNAAERTRAMDTPAKKVAAELEMKGAEALEDVQLAIEVARGTW